MSKNILFITEALFKERTGASNAIDGKQIFPMIKVAQDIYIQSALGSDLYNRLLTGIVANNLNANEENLIDNYITDSLVWYTMSMLPITMGYQLFSKGFLQKTSEESQTPSRADLELIEQKYKSMAEFYKERMIKYLQENFELYFEYLNHSNAIDVIFPDRKAYTSPIYLGDRKQSLYGSISANSTSAIPSVATYIATDNETSFTINALIGRTPVLAFRSGLQKVITTNTTSDTQYLQIVNGVITLPTGDLTIAGEVFTIAYR